MRTYVFDVPEGEPVRQILVTLYEPRDFEEPNDPGDWTPDERVDVAARTDRWGTWGPPLDLVAKQGTGRGR